MSLGSHYLIEAEHPLGFSMTQKERATGSGDAQIRVLAAEINNCAMTLGAGSVRVSSENSDLARAALERVNNVYLQVSEVSKMVYGTFSMSLADHREGENNRNLGASDEAFLYPKYPRQGTYIGVNLGQTLTKVATIENGFLKPGSEKIYPSASQRAAAIYKDAIEGIERQLSGDKCQGIGISTGGMVYQGRIIPNSGITFGMSETEVELLNSMQEFLTVKYKVPVVVEQDVVAKGCFLAPVLNLKKALVVDIGTSFGAVYIDENGNIPKLLNQVGRVVIDTSDSAIPRPDGTAKGILTQYLSLQALKRRGFDPSRIDEEGQSLVADFGGLLAKALNILSKYYDFEKVVLTGGIMKSNFGMRLSDEASLKISPEPLLDACLGVSYLAAAA